jgi:para-nitrobenzyl esterase
MKNIILFLLSFSLMHYNSLAQNNSFPVKAALKNGTIEGNYDTKTGIQKFFGIPYAQPPIGDLRWKAPVVMGEWEGIKETKHFGPRAVQAPVFGDMRFRSDGISEDCLYLNVWAPSSVNSKKLPVLVYFYGGGFVAGDGSEPRYDGEAMAKEGIVVVTVNYRLNIFGFFAHPELSEETSYKGSGNYGLMDQALALKWVSENIGAFGGDPSKVTIAGESAGSISVSAQMASPLARDLIAGAIGESGAAINPTLYPIPLLEAEKAGLEFAESIGYPSLAELRNLSTKQVYEFYVASKRFGFSTVIDGYFYPKTIPQIFNAKEQAQVPLLLGWNSAEIPGQAFMQGLPYTKENFISKVKQVYPNNHEEVLSLYAHNTQREVELSATALASDRFISYSTWKWFDLHRKNSQQPVYRYLFSRVRPPLVDQSLTSALAGGTVKKDPNAPKPPAPVGASHASEIEYCMGNLSNSPEFAWTLDDYKVSETMMRFFANFIKTGNPNGENLPEWSKAEPKDKMPAVMNIDLESKTIKATNDTRYEFLDRSYGN